MKKVLVVRFSALGDLVLASGPLRILKNTQLDLKIDLLTSPTGEELFQNELSVDQCIVLPKGASLWQMISCYRKLQNYDAVIDLQGNFKSYFLKIFLKCSFYKVEKHSKERRAFVKDRSYQDRLTHHVVEKYFKAFKKAFDLKSVSLETLRPQLFSQKIVFNKNDFDFSRAIAVHPYASQKNKVWPHTKELISQLVDKNYNVVILGSYEQPLALEFHPQILNLTNKTSLSEMSSILTSCKALVTTDSGPMHMGLAAETPTLALFGPTTKEFGFYPSFKKSLVIENQSLDCRPCHVHGGDFCPLGHHKCMKDISSEQVTQALEKLLTDSSAKNNLV